MNKKDLVAKVAMDTGLSKVHAEATVDSLLDGIGKALKKGDSVTLAGFGSFKTAPNSPDQGGVRFKAGKALRDRIRI
jgi:DNA-binding protein HU-beta